MSCIGLAILIWVAAMLIALVLVRVISGEWW